MLVEMQLLEQVLFPPSENPQTEVEKATEIRDQLTASIEWMEFIAPNEINDLKKSDLINDIKNATRERDRLTTELNKVN